MIWMRGHQALFSCEQESCHSVKGRQLSVFPNNYRFVFQISEYEKGAKFLGCQIIDPRAKLAKLFLRSPNRLVFEEIIPGHFLFCSIS